MSSHFPAESEANRWAFRPVNDPGARGTQSLKGRTYVALPAAGVVTIVMTFQLPRFRYEMFAIAVLCVTVAFGLHGRERWAWQWNWIVLAVICLAMLVALPLRDSHGDFADFVANRVN